ncbi:MAG: GNAT family N-acetyltransferase, partial [Nocardioides sp.]|nr:GNAT family N-acetyltransferase [Nocardioides sp.]
MLTPQRYCETVPVDLTWLGLHHLDLTSRQMHDLLMLRHDVFVIEQDCPYYRDIDGLDAADGTHHVLALHADQLVACARVLAPGGDRPEVRIGRVVVAPTARGSGAGHDLMRQSLTLCEQVWPAADIFLSAQAHLEQY